MHKDSACKVEKKQLFFCVSFSRCRDLNIVIESPYNIFEIYQIIINSTWNIKHLYTEQWVLSG